MKKIIIINHYGVTPELAGATKHYDMGKYFSEKKTHEVEFWMCGYNHKTGKNHLDLKGFKIQSKVKEDNYSVIKIKSTPYRKNLILRQLNIIFFDFITTLKILFSRDVEAIVLNVPPISFLNVWAIKMRKIKLIVDVEDLWPLFLIELGLENKIAINYMDKFSKYTYKSANKIATVSEGMLNYVRDIIGSDKEMWISPLGVKVEDFFNKEKDRKLITNKEWKNDFKIMYLGAHGKANDIISVLDTVKEFNFKVKEDDKKTSFIFIGDGDYKSEIVKHAENLNLNNVYFEDAVASNLVADYLIHADICLTNLMKIESFKLVRPNKLFQYMALGKPIVSGIWGEFKSIIENVNSGVYVDFTKPKEASDLINKLIKDEKELDHMGRNGIEYVRKEGDRNKIFETFYKNII